MKKESDIEYEKIEKLLKNIPSPRLPQSLSAESLFDKMDKGEIKINDNVIHLKESKSYKITKYLKPVLSYASVFLIAVFVYYIIGLDSPSFTSQDISTSMVSLTAIDEAIPYEGGEQYEITQFSIDEELKSIQQTEETEKFMIKSAPPMLSNENESLVSETATDEIIAKSETHSFYNDIYENADNKSYYPPNKSREIKSSSIIYDDTNDKSQLILGEDSSVEVDGKAIDFIEIKDNKIAVISTESRTEELYNSENIGEFVNISSSYTLPATKISIYSTKENTPTLIYTSYQEGEYIKHITDNESVLVATYKPINSDNIIAPLVAENNDGYRVVSPENVYKFPNLPNNEYILLSYLDTYDKELHTKTDVILGNNMTVEMNAILNTINVFANDLQSKASSCISFMLGDYKVTMS